MCGRYVIAGDAADYAEHFRVDRIVADPREPSFNVAPTDQVLAVAEHDDERLLGTMRWGLLPHWAKDAKKIHINARAETVATSRLFAESFARRRCILPATGFYEWEPKERGRTPHWIHRADGFPMAFAGIWSSWKDPVTDAWVRTCSIITTEAEGGIRAIHDRMPLILPDEVWDAWLDRDLVDVERVRHLMHPMDPDLLMEHSVSRRVNSVRNEGPELITPDPGLPQDPAHQ
jgi:putative SOS response-associated peptidase YedK